MLIIYLDWRGESNFPSHLKRTTKIFITARRDFRGLLSSFVCSYRGETWRDTRSLPSHITEADKSPARSNVTRLHPRFSLSLSLSSSLITLSLSSSLLSAQKMLAADSTDGSWLRTRWKSKTVNFSDKEHHLRKRERVPGIHEWNCNTNFTPDVRNEQRLI